MNIETQIKLDKFKPRDKRKLKVGSLNHSYRHGKSKTNTYKIWVGLLSRCYNSKVRIYKYYGGRGITVCPEWHDFVNFLNDMGERPQGLQLDRIDNKQGYFKDNCRWVTAKENNAANKGDLVDTMPGKKFGKWLVIERVKHKQDHWYYKCRCDCGFEAIRAGGELRRGKSTQCINCKNNAHKGWFERYQSE